MAVQLVTLEGLIGAGKSKQIELLKKTFADKDVVVLEEPVQSWMNAGLLQAFYNGELTAVAFQLSVLVSLFGPLLSAVLKKPKLIISERSPFSNYNVFAKANLSGVELSAYSHAYHELMKALPEVNTTMILLDVPVEVAADRIYTRDRISEHSISHEYLAVLADKHNDLSDEVPNSTLIRLDASGTVEATHEAVVSCVEAVLASA